MKKKLIKPSRIFKKSTSSVRFWFYKSETEKTKPNPNKKKLKTFEPNRKKTEKTKPNRFELVFVLK
jgi:hypothetical protein